MKKVIFGCEKDSVAIRYIQLYNIVYSLIEDAGPFAAPWGHIRTEMNIQPKMNEYNEYLFAVSGNYTGGTGIKTKNYAR